MAKRAKLIMLTILLLFMTSCWDQKEIDKFAYVIAMGMDITEQGDGLLISYLIENPEFGPQGGGTSEPPREIITFQANDFIVAKNIANTIISKEITFDGLSDIFVSEELAKNEDFIRYIYDAAKDIEIRRDAELIITKERAADFLTQNNPLFERKSHRYFELIIERGREDGLLPANSKLLYYYRIAEAGNDIFLATYATTELTNNEYQQDDENFLAGGFHVEGEVNHTQFAGSAVFFKGKMIGTLTGDETRISLLLNNTQQVDQIYTDFPDPFNEQYDVTVKLNAKDKNKLSMDVKSTIPKLDVVIPLKVDVVTNHSMTDYTDIKNRNILKNTIERIAKDKVTQLIEKTQKEFKANPFGWSLAARKKFLTIEQFDDYHWVKKYPEMDVSVSVNVKFGQFGRQTELPDMEKMRD